ncbi:MAG: PASTA domain-containing protein [Flavobacteriaceae bacterium]|jgi:beta-lactam-binding protein with PASTA domain|nr:PASTA domain-containing protein [Flavobacteriaceae bacterium]MBT3920723.1 PASTA domain-containing protein [Flavobacteriaceae bacterium]MBT6705260.1 PASTA domain-containing protein [Flavobacteriaceae bacterium]|tara:strand:+ start:262 stop:852 length:591 start_codon:yes stop_codon:yes gene_type:complete
MTFIKFLFTKVFLKQLSIAIIALLGLAFVILFWLKFTTNHDQKIEVPSLAKMSLDTAENKLNEIDLRFEVIDSSNYNPNFPKYSVIEQIPKAGEFVKENRKIYLTLNRSGYVYLKIPEVVGKTRRQAEPTLISMGFEIGRITYKSYIALDEVLELSYKGKKLKSGEKIQKTSVIDLVLGDGEGGLKTQLENSEKEI